MPDTTINPAINPLQPGAYSFVDPSALIDGDQSVLSPVVAVVGVAQGGKPLSALYFRGPGPLRQVLRGGPGYDVARFAFAGGAQRVCFVRVGNSVAQSTLALAGATSTPITLTSKDYGAWTATIKAQVATNNVVTITYTDPTGAVFTETFNCGSSATAQDVADFINGKKYGVPASAYVTAAVTAGTMPLTVAGLASLTGGSDGTSPASGDWTAGYAVLESEEVSIVVPATGDATQHAALLTHANNMSTSLARKERTVVAGGVAGETTSQAAARMTGALLDKRFQLAYPGMYEFDSAGNLALYDPFYAAGKLAGLHAALRDPATSLVHAGFPAIDMERRLSSIQNGDIDTLLAAGVTPIAPRPGGGWWIVDSLSGYRTDETFRSFHKIRNADYVAQRARTVLESKFVGQKSLAGSASAILAAANSLLRDLRSEEVIRAFQTPVVTATNTRTYTVSLPVMLVDAVKFIFITVALQPSSTVNTDVGFTAADNLA